MRRRLRRYCSGSIPKRSSWLQFKSRRDLLTRPPLRTSRKIGESPTASIETQVDWYATSQAVTRTTKCHVLRKLPVDMVIGSQHIHEYDMLAIGRAKAALLSRSDHSKGMTSSEELFSSEGRIADTRKEETIRRKREDQERDGQNRDVTEREISFDLVVARRPPPPQTHLESPNLVREATRAISPRDDPPMPIRSAPATPSSEMLTATPNSSLKEQQHEEQVAVVPGRVAELRNRFATLSTCNGLPSGARR